MSRLGEDPVQTSVRMKSIKKSNYEEVKEIVEKILSEK